jgi:hypothetical protein
MEVMYEQAANQDFSLNDNWFAISNVTSTVTVCEGVSPADSTSSSE